MSAEGEHIRAIGWLHPDYPFSQGAVSPAFLARLKLFASQAALSTKALFFPIWCGVHQCEFCDQSIGAQNFGVPAADLLYIAPEMIVHYVEAHDYCPPLEFQNAVMNSPLPETEEYQVLCEPFWHLHRKAVESMTQIDEHLE
jgi:hypothetical protein